MQRLTTALLVNSANNRACVLSIAFSTRAYIRSSTLRIHAPHTARKWCVALHPLRHTHGRLPPRALLTQLQLPLGLLTAATGHPMLVELKSGETLNGLLVNCDTWMNLTLREVVQTSADGDKFMRLPEIYVRGSTVS